VVPMCFPEGVTSPTLGVVLLVGVLIRMLVPVVMEAVARWVAIFRLETNALSERYVCCRCGTGATKAASRLPERSTSRLLVTGLQPRTKLLNRRPRPIVGLERHAVAGSEQDRSEVALDVARPRRRTLGSRLLLTTSASNSRPADSAPPWKT
jgi:hypothetical protein